MKILFRAMKILFQFMNISFQATSILASTKKIESCEELILKDTKQFDYLPVIKKFTFFFLLSHKIYGWK